MLEELMNQSKIVRRFSTNLFVERLGEVLKKIENMTSELAALLFLLYEKANPDSFWKPYFNVLPENLGTPLQYSFEELMQMEGCFQHWVFIFF